MAAPTLSIAARGVTDVGQRRGHNEDSFLVDEALGLFIIADGMGGHAGGGTASRLAVETIRDTIAHVKAHEPERLAAAAPDDRIPHLLQEAVDKACALIYRTGQEQPELAGMGTTVTAALIHAGIAYVAHVGDSRCYLLRGGRIYQISEDHSLVNEQLKAGAISAEEAKHSRFRNIITRSVGFEERVQVDIMGVELEAGDAVLICCDGLSNMVEDPEILTIVDETPIDVAPERLVALANDRGGDDNITVIVIRVV